MYKLICILISSSFIILTSCLNYSKNEDKNFTQFGFHEFGGNEQESEIWIQDKYKWEAMHSLLNLNRYPQPEPEEINFDKNSVLIISFGKRNNGGFSASVTDVQIKKDSVLVFLNTKSPAPNSLSTTVMTTPYLLLSIPKTDNRPVKLIKNPKSNE